MPVIKKASPVENEQGDLMGVVEAVTDISELKRATQIAEEAAIRLGDLQSMDQMIGKSHAIHKVFTALKAAAASDATILIQGESGTGKELAANAIHYNSDRREHPFITVNCSALSESLLESELFGHVKGAYTGAVKDRLGRFEEAEGGTIFLDEIGELSPYIQVKLLRVLQEREIERVGESVKRKVDIRVITATHRDLLSMVAEGKFREDLYYRLKVFPIHLPPLRERRDDIPLLVNAFVEKMGKKTGKPISQVSQTAMRILLDYHWPGNVRELENAIEHGFVLCNGTILSPDELPREITELDRVRSSGVFPDSAGSPVPVQDQHLRAPHSSEMRERSFNPGYRYQPPVNINGRFSERYNPGIPLNAQTASSSRKRGPKISKEELLVLLEEYDWNKKEVGRVIGVSHTAIWKYMKKWNIPLKRPASV